MRIKKAKATGNSRIYYDLERMLNDIIHVTVNFPRQFKYTIGENIIERTIKCMHNITAAYLHKDVEVKMRYMTEFDADFKIVNTLMRISVKEGWISFGKQALFIECIENINKQFAAWKNKLENTASACMSEPQGQG